VAIGAVAIGAVAIGAVGRELGNKILDYLAQA